MDIDDELLGLAEGTTTAKSRRPKSNKRKRPVEESSQEDDSASDMDMSASDSDAPPAPAASSSRPKGSKAKSSQRVDRSDDEDAEGQPTEENPYPVEGIYTDEAERERVAMMPELEREDFIASRRDLLTQRKMRADVAAMVARSSGAAAAAQKKKAKAAFSDDEDDEYGEDSRATRSRKTTGSSKTKSETIEKLKQSRAAKGKKKTKTSDSDEDYEEGPKKATRRKAASEYSGSDMEQSSDEDKPKKGRLPKSSQPVAGFEQLSGLQATRTRLANLCQAPFFDTWVQGAWVRMPKPDMTQERAYRMHQVIEVRRDTDYRVEGVKTDLSLRVRYGNSTMTVRMDAISNSPVQLDEYQRMVATFKADKADLPTPVQAKKLKEEFDKHTIYLLTEADVAAQLAAKNNKPMGAVARARLRMELQDALRVGDEAAAAEVRARIAEFEGPAKDKEDADRAKRINDRNRAANREEIKRAEAKSQEERRKQAEALLRGDTSVVVDKSARVKTVPRHTYDSRPATPGGSGASTPVPAAAVAAAATTAAAAQNGAPKPKGGKIESIVASRVQLDLSDLDF
ncbi:RNA polymerase-associated protein rtf1 [Rhodotorula sphaerocarpa]